MSFTDDESTYLRSQPIARVATLGADGQPDVVPLAFEFDGTFVWSRRCGRRRRTRRPLLAAGQ
ncbi:MAG TPA: pyridoxamine 5'-phosphate oxidase family protein, partial [Kineosporiaceae bacterium]|nr:pyridoxamine 5'-phosphate oxidase family protein [Kineosporiaceae bacterium]